MSAASAVCCARLCSASCCSACPHRAMSNKETTDDRGREAHADRSSGLQGREAPTHRSKHVLHGQDVRRVVGLHRTARHWIVQLVRHVVHGRRHPWHTCTARDLLCPPTLCHHQIQKNASLESRWRDKKDAPQVASHAREERQQSQHSGVCACVVDGVGGVGDAIGRFSALVRALLSCSGVLWPLRVCSPQK